jgi:hypothetical protein
LALIPDLRKRRPGNVPGQSLLALPTLRGRYVDAPLCSMQARATFELLGLDRAREQDVVAAGEAIRELGKPFWAGEESQMDVADESGATVCSLTFSSRAA